MIVVDGDRRVLEVNPAAGKLPGLGEGAVGAILAEDHPLRAWLDRNPQFTEPLLTIGEIGTTFEVSVQRLEKWGRDGSVMAVLRDVTAREAAQQQLAAASRDLVIRLNENLALQNKLAEEASRDHLTGLYNRRHASKIIPEFLAANAPGRAIAFALIDLDHFKQVNDQFGHDIGDRVLAGFANILRDNMPAGGYAFRFGGEEFLVVMPGVEETEALIYAARWRARFANDAPALAPGFTLTFSAGIAIFPHHGESLGACTKAADIALYDAKMMGRNCDVVWREKNQLHIAS